MSNSTPRAALPQPSAQGPAELWLQLHGDTLETGLPVDYTGDDVTWCWHKINDSDVRYVRADLAAEQVEQIRRETVQACAEAAEALVTQHWQDYKRGTHRADPHYQGMSDGAQEVLDAILDLLPVKEPKE